MTKIDFIHAVDPDDYMAVNNLCFIKHLVSAEYGPHEKSIRDIPLDKLTNNPIDLGAISPRALWSVWAAAIIRNGGHITRGVHPYPSVSATKEAEARWLRMGDMELAFEKIRRALKPDAPSRLSALYLADDSRATREGLGRMFPRRRILKVVLVNAARMIRADPKWLGDYQGTSAPTAIENYWNSVPHPSHEFWEYLVDGSVKLHSSEDTPELAAFVAANQTALNAENERTRLPEP